MSNPILARMQATAAVAQQSPAVLTPPPTQPVTPMEQRAAAVESLPTDYTTFYDIIRICNIPTYHGMTDAEVEQFNRENVMAKAYAEGFRLHKVQCEALEAYEVVAGLLGNIGVGWGKGLISMGIAERAWKKGIQKILLMIPSHVLDQTVNQLLKMTREKIPFTVPVNILGGRDTETRRQMVKSGRKGLYIWTYSLLSAKDASDIITGIKAGLVISDEFHNLARMSAARSRRVRDYMDECNPEFAALSGTITDKSIKDYYYAAKWALKDNCPLPLATSLANEWGLIIDAEAGRCDIPPTATGALKPLVDWARREFPNEHFTDDTAGFRKAYRLRLNTVPGVVSTGDAEIGTSLVVSNTPVEKHDQALNWDKAQNLIDQIEDAWLTPNGDEIDHAINKWKWLNELNAGFYNELTWPTPEEYAQRITIPYASAVARIDHAQFHHSLMQVYHKHLRKWIEEHCKAGFDTPFLVGKEMQANQGAAIIPRRHKEFSNDLYTDWRNAKDAEAEYEKLFGTEMLVRDSRAVRVCSFKIDAAVEWVKQLPAKSGCLLWVWHIEMGRWLCEAMETSGLQPLYCPAGRDHDPIIGNPANRHRRTIASIRGHGEGKNLQHYHLQRCLQFPRSAKQAEQLLGRTHRNGQAEDEVRVNTCHTTEFDQMNFAACLNDALYIHQTTGNRQKLIIADYDPLPKIFPSAVLHERGLLNRILTVEQQRLLDDKFATK